MWKPTNQGWDVSPSAVGAAALFSRTSHHLPLEPFAALTVRTKEPPLATDHVDLASLHGSAAAIAMLPSHETMSAVTVQAGIFFVDQPVSVTVADFPAP